MYNRQPTPSSVTSGLLMRRAEDSRVGCSARVQDEDGTEPQSSVGATLQDSEPEVATRESTPLPFQEADPDCSGVRTFDGCDILVHH